MKDTARVKKHRKNVATGGLCETYSFRLLNGCQQPITSKLPEDLNRQVMSETINNLVFLNSVEQETVRQSQSNNSRFNK